jgi:hypothetical protein
MPMYVLASQSLLYTARALLILAFIFGEIRQRFRIRYGRKNPNSGGKGLGDEID